MNKVRPSSLPKLAACPQWLSDTFTSEAAERGTDLHAAIEAALKGDTGLMNLLSDEDEAAAQWGVDYVRTVMPMDEQPLMSELGVTVSIDGHDPITGTLDHACGVHIVDIKSGMISQYDLQLAAYALGYMQSTAYDRVCCHVVFIDQKKSRQFWLGREECEAMLRPVLDAVAANKPATPCDYCRWCANRLGCPALRETTDLVAGRLELDGWEPPTLDLLSRPDVAAKTMAGIKAVKDWCSATEDHIKALMVEGMEVPGYRLITGFRRDLPAAKIPEAYAALGVSQGAFLGACSLGLSKLEAAVAKEKGITGAEAKRLINDALGDMFRTTQMTTIRRTK